LFIKSDAPHFVQMHAGEIDQTAMIADRHNNL
jgi:hypothetical protein